MCVFCVCVICILLGFVFVWMNVVERDRIVFTNFFFTLNNTLNNVPRARKCLKHIASDMRFEKSLKIFFFVFFFSLVFFFI